VRHRPRYPRYPALLGVGLLRAADAEAEDIFTTLLAHNAHNFYSPLQAAWVVPEDDPGPALRGRLGAFLKQAESGP
jgi:hypothetical protein